VTERSNPAASIRRLVWHPVSIAGCLTGLAAVAVAAALRRPDLGWLVWAPLGATAGLATSGSV
jgi:hypothetical protein